MKKLFELIEKNLVSTRFINLFRSKNESSTQLPIITFSREKGSGGRIIANRVVKLIGPSWKVFHKQIIEEISKESGMQKNLIKEIDERNIPLIEEIVADLFGKRYYNLTSYYKALVKTLSTIGQRGHVIIIGRGANFLFPKSLKIRVICEMQQRVKWLMEYEKLTKKQAEQLIEKSDRERREYSQALFHHDPRKAHHYDLVIRTSEDLDVNAAAELIATFAKTKFRL